MKNKNIRDIIRGQSYNKNNIGQSYNKNNMGGVLKVSLQYAITTI